MELYGSRTDERSNVALSKRDRGGLQRAKCTTITVLFAAAATVLVACSVAMRTHLFNNSGIDVLVNRQTSLGFRDALLPPQKEIEFGVSSFSLFWAPDGCQYKYQFVGRPPNEYFETRELSLHRYVQLDPDGRIFILRVGDTAPVDSDSYPQPPGFPLVAEKLCGDSR